MRSSLYRHTDDMQLSVYFTSLEFLNNISWSTITEVCSKLSADLKLSPSKTDFMLLAYLNSSLKLISPNVRKFRRHFISCCICSKFGICLRFKTFLCVITYWLFLNHIFFILGISDVLDLDLSRAGNNAAAPVHFQLDYCYSVFLSLPVNQLDHLNWFWILLLDFKY